jgi:PAS domain S-box-containing protein
VTGARPGSELEQIRYALDQSAIVATTDVSGRIKYVNDKFCQISKYSREELLGQDHRIINSGYHSAEYIRNLWRTIAQGRIWRGELRNRAKDGSIYWVDTTIVPFLDERGKPWQYMAIRYDITERKQHEQRLRDQAALISLGEMAAVIAHEVRNPLAGIRGGVQLLASALPEESDSSQFIADIVARIDSLNAVIGDLLSFARLRDLKLARIEMSPLLSDVVRSLRYDPALVGISWDVHVDDDLAIEGDVDQLRLVFTNLALNAAQATAANGTVTVIARMDGDRSVIEIADEGPGIPTELGDRVFEPFFTTKHRGTGLGLPTAKRIVEAHGGTLTLQPASQRGTVARVVLPHTQNH